jgi:integrase
MPHKCSRPYPRTTSADHQSNAGCGHGVGWFLLEEGGTIITIDSTSQPITHPDEPGLVDEAQLAAVAFLARYSSRTLEAYRHDLRALFQWAADYCVPVLEATRAHLELYRASMEERGLAASTIDRRVSTVCGLYRFAHIDGRITSNPAQYVRRPKVHPSEQRGLDGGELGRFLFTAERFDHAHAALAVLLGLNGLRVSEACETNIEDMGMERGIGSYASSAKATSPPSSRNSAYGRRLLPVGLLRP